MSYRLRELGWGAAGFLAAFLIFASIAALWGIHIDRIGEVVVQRPTRPRAHSAPPRGPRGGDAAQPAQAGQPPTPAKAPAHHHHGDVAGHAHPQPAAVTPDVPAAEASPAPTTGKPAGEEAAGSTTTVTPESTTPESSTGLLDNPGGTVGNVVCSVNALGIRVCTE